MDETQTALTVQAQYNESQLDVLKRTIAKDLDALEFGLLVEVSRRTGLDLFARQLYGIKRGGKMTLQTGIDGYRLMAARTGVLAGIDDAIYDTEDGKHPNKASVTVYRLLGGQRMPYTATARWLEYYQPQGGMWDKMPFLMLGKCAEALALRKAFPAELSGIYTGEEMQQADDLPTVVNHDTGEIRRTAAVRPIVEESGLNWTPILNGLAQAPFRCRTGTEKMSKLAELLGLDTVQSTAALTAEDLQTAKDAIFAAQAVSGAA